jgi:hypothetical protein
MKRSEMVTKIQDWFVISGLSEQLIHLNLIKYVARELLSECEKAGMKPPFSNEQFQKACRVEQEPCGYKWDEE